MYLPFEGGTVEHIQGLHINIPPVGFVPDYYSGTGKLILSEILFADKPTLDQKWERQNLPAYYAKKYAVESKLRETNPEHRDEDLQPIRKLHWQRRLNGVWVMIKGNPVYLTGKHWYYMNWWSLDSGYPMFRENDRKVAYFWQYIVEDPFCGGIIESTKRKQGKTYRAACFQFEYISRVKNSLMGIQSKAALDAQKQVFAKSLIAPFKAQPDFFRPIYDTSAGIVPKKELAFRYTSVKGKGSSDQTFDGELDTVIDWRSAETDAYDGPKLQAAIVDEILKTKDVDVLERHRVLRECILLDGAFIGKMYCTSTVEKDEDKPNQKDNEEAIEKLWYDSDQYGPRTNGRTKTTLYRYLTPAYETFYWDDYGYPLIEKAKAYYKIERDMLANDPKGYVSFVRKNPFNEQEMFMTDSDQCPFTVKEIDDTLEYIHNLPRDSQEIEVQGDFIWSERDKKSIWIPNSTNGKWFISNLPPAQFQNMVRDTMMPGENRFVPLNDIRFSFGIDPVNSGEEATYGSSKAAGVIFRKYDIYHEPERSNTFIADYLYDPANPEDFYEDMIIACHFFGCQAFIESNKFDIYNHFCRRGYRKFVMTRPENTFKAGSKPGEPAAGAYASTPFIDLYVNREKVFYSPPNKDSALSGGVRRCRNKRILHDAKKFRNTSANRSKRDTTVAAGYALVASEKPFEVPIVHSFDFFKETMKMRR